jgi:nitrogen fixation/metabolism regulation signal transduction histidine kinase
VAVCFSSWATASSWFDVRVDRALEGGLNLGRGALDFLLKETSNKAGQIALALSDPGTGSVTTRLIRAAEQAGVHEAALFTAAGSVIAVGGVGGTTAPPEPPGAQALRRLQQTTTAIGRPGDGRLLLRSAPVNSEGLEPLRVAAGRRARADGTRPDVDKVIRFARLSGSRVHARIAEAVYAVTLTLTLLLLLTAPPASRWCSQAVRGAAQAPAQGTPRSPRATSRAGSP